MKTKKWKALEAISDSRGENNDCSVKALAMFANVRYMVAHAALKNEGRKDGRGVNVNMILEASAKLGKPIDVAFEDGRITANRKSKETVGRTMIVVRGHVIYVNNQMINDHDSCNKRYVQMVLTPRVEA
jgi:hypothetical protein